MTHAERSIVVRLAEQEPAVLLSLLAGCLAPQVTTLAPPPCPVVPPVSANDRRAGDDPYLITEDEFSYRAQYMSRAEQQVLRCRVNAARAHKAGYLDEARRYRQRADRLERSLSAA